MIIDCNPVKEALNFQLHGCSLALAGLIDWSTAIITEDRREGYFERYDEMRYRAFGLVVNVVYFIAFTPRLNADNRLVMRPISVRKAKRNEVRNYENARNRFANKA